MTTVPISKLGPRLKIVALIDPSLERSAFVLADKRASFVEQAYRDTKAFKTIEEFVAGMSESEKPRSVPTFHHPWRD